MKKKQKKVTRPMLWKKMVAKVQFYKKMEKQLIKLAKSKEGGKAVHGKIKLHSAFKKGGNSKLSKKVFKDFSDFVMASWKGKPIK